MAHRCPAAMDGQGVVSDTEAFCAFDRVCAFWGVAQTCVCDVGSRDGAGLPDSNGDDTATQMGAGSIGTAALRAVGTGFEMACCPLPSGRKDAHLEDQ